jgi:SpoIIAA-like
MIRRLEESSGNVLGWEVTGKVTEEEVRTLSEEFKAAIAEHGKVRVLIRMRRIPRMELAGWVEDFKLTPYAKNVERYAIVVLEIIHFGRLPPPTPPTPSRIIPAYGGDSLEQRTRTRRGGTRYMPRRGRSRPHSLPARHHCPAQGLQRSGTLPGTFAGPRRR